jgi:hypothetical protein
VRRPPSRPAQQGGTGKTQIAVAFSHALWGARAVDALVWVPATSREAIVAGFAQAARTVGAADRAAPAEVRVDGVSPAVLATWSLAAECAPGCRPRAPPGRLSRWPPCSTRTASPVRC